MAVLTVDSSMHTSTLLKIDSVLHSNFPDDPDFDYQDQRRRVLRHLGLLADEPTQNRQTQVKQTLTQRFTQRRMNNGDQLDDDDDEEPEEDNLEEEEDFSVQPSSKRPKFSQAKEVPRIATRMSIPDFDEENEIEQNELMADKELQSRFGSRHMTTARNTQQSTQRNGSRTQPPPRSQAIDEFARSTIEDRRATQRSERNHPVTTKPASTNITISNESQHTTKSKKRTIGHMLLDSQVGQEEDEGNIEDDVNFLFGEMFDETVSAVTPSVTKRSTKYY